MNTRNQTQQQQPKAKPASASSKASGWVKNTTKAKENGMAAKVVTEGKGREVTVPLGMLDISEVNARKSARGNIDALAASIKAQGQLQNIVVHAGADGRFKIAGGGRRFLAFKQLETSGFWNTEQEIRALVVDEGEALAASYAENMHEAMHPADEFDAFKNLVADNWTIDRIADAFGVTALVVERRLRLSAAAPALLQEFREGELSTDQLIALCATDDHDRQVAVWSRKKNIHWDNDPKALRRAVLADGEIDISRDSRIGFIGGLDVYRAAGGEVRGDLFSGDGKSGGFITDESLLDSLVTDKLEAHAANARAEGWGWVDIWPTFDHSAFHRLGDAPLVQNEIPEAEQGRMATLRAESEANDAEQEEMHAQTEADDSDLTDEQWKRDDAIDTRRSEIADEIEAIELAHAAYAPEVMAASGVVVVRDGVEVKTYRGKVKTADRKAVTAAAGEDVSGGRETESAGRKPDAVSDALRRSLLGHRNLAAQIMTAERPDVAKVLLACSMVENIRSSIGGGYRGAGTPCDYVIGRDGHGGTRTYHPITDDAGTAKTDAFRAKIKATIKKLPEAEGALWDALTAMKSAELDKIIAIGVALSVSLSTEGTGLTGKFLAALGFDMGEHFAATAENYLGRVPKPLVVEALKEAGKLNSDSDALLAMKKGALATEAENRLADTGWVPKIIRTPKPKAKAPTKAASKSKAKKS